MSTVVTFVWDVVDDTTATGTVAYTFVWDIVEDEPEAHMPNVPGVVIA